MITVYAKYFIPTKASGFGLNDGDTEKVLWTIPNQNGSQVLPLDAKVNVEMGAAGNFEFSLAVNNPYYAIWKQMKTIVRVDYDGTTIFYGRVLTIDRDMFRTKRIHCEGALTFFMDSVFEGTQNGTLETLNFYLNRLINTHNDCMGDSSPEKKIRLGWVPGEDSDEYHYPNYIDDIQKIPNDTQKFAKNKGYKTVKEWLDEIVQDYGGFLRIRYVPSDSDNAVLLYLDWLKVCYETLLVPNSNNSQRQTLTVYKNALDISDTTEVDNIFTHVIPVGKNNKYLADGGGGGGGDSGGGSFSVVVTKSGGGTASASPSSARKGTTITLSAAPVPGWRFVRWILNAADFHQTPTLSGNTFTMPECNVNARADFEPIEGGEDPDS